MLEKRNVTSVDLAPIFPKTKFPNEGERHRLAIEWFLLCLEAGKPHDPEDWPLSEERGLSAPSSAAMPEVFKPETAFFQNEPREPEGPG